MSQDPETDQYAPPPVDQSGTKEWKKKRFVTHRVKAAILDLIEQTAIRKRPDIQGVATQHGITPGTLSQTWYRWKRGLIDLGPRPKGQREIKMRLEMTRTIDACAHVDQVLNDILERKLEKVNEAKLAGDLDAYEKEGIDKVMNSLMKSNELRKQKEKGYLAIMEQRPEEKNVTPHPEQGPIITPTPGPGPRVQRAIEQRSIEEIFGEPVQEAEVLDLSAESVKSEPA